MNNMMCKEAMKLAEEVFEEEYSGLDKDSFLIGFQEAYNALTTLYKDKFELVKRMREAQIVERRWGIVNFKTEEDKVACGEAIRRMYQLESEVDEWLGKMK